MRGFMIGDMIRNSIAMKFCSDGAMFLEPKRMYMISKTTVDMKVSMQVRWGTQVCMNFFLFSMEPRHVLTK